MTVANSPTTPTNAIDFAGTAVTAASFNTTNDQLTVTTAGGTSTLQLSGTYAAGTVVDFVSDGSSGTDLFLSTDPAFHARGTNDSWLDPTSWGGTVPTADPNGAGASYAFFNYDANSDDIYMPPTLQQATGTGTTTWTISDSLARRQCSTPAN